MSFRLGKIIGREMRDGRRELSPSTLCLIGERGICFNKAEWGEDGGGGEMGAVLVKVSAVEQQAQ